MPDQKKILVTGDRYWTDREAVRQALLQAWRDLGATKDILLIQGECPHGGADLIAKELWESAGFPVKSMPAETDPETGRFLGPERNARMVAEGPDICLAFLTPESRGTKNCVRLAELAKIPVKKHWGTR